MTLTWISRRMDGLCKISLSFSLFLRVQPHIQFSISLFRFTLSPLTCHVSQYSCLLSSSPWLFHFFFADLFLWTLCYISLFHNQVYLSAFLCPENTFLDTPSLAASLTQSFGNFSLPRRAVSTSSWTPPNILPSSSYLHVLLLDFLSHATATSNASWLHFPPPFLILSDSV